MKIKLATLSLALFPLVLAAPAFATAKDSGRSSKGTDAPRLAAPVLLPGMHGEGEGIWRAPTKSAGRLRVASKDSATGLVLGFDAAITRVHPKGSDPREIGGDLLGDVIVVDRFGSRGVATIAGKWTQDPDGQGFFVAHIYVATGDSGEPLAAVGRCFGPFEAPLPGSGPTKKGSVTLRWDVQ